MTALTTLLVAVTLLAKQTEMEYQAFLPYLRYDRPWDATALVVNPSFELGHSHDTRWWEWGNDAPRFEQFDNIRTPSGWTSWWVNHRPCPGFELFPSGKPEITQADLGEGFPDPLRVKEGAKALKFFTYWKCHYGGLLQVINVPASTYRACFYAHSWYTRCSTQPHAGPLERDCKTPVVGTAMTFRIGLAAGEVLDYWRVPAWSEPATVYGAYGPELCSPWARANGTLTLWLASEVQAPLKHNDWYADAVRLEGMR